jgi:hypothetical protein
MTKKEIVNEFIRLFGHLTSLEPGSDEYQKTLDQMQKFDLIFKGETKLNRVLKNPALLNVIGTSLGLGMVLYHERAEVITSRAFGWLRFR